MAAREQRRVFGEVADAYDEIRPGYPLEIAGRIAAYLGRTPDRIVESGAGTGKGTAVLRTFAAPLTCVEPDPAMAAVLRRRFAGDDLVEVFLGSFEDWAPPPGGVDLLASAQAWHWVDPTRRNQLAYDALAPGGALAVFGHHYGFAEGPFLDEMDAIYDRLAPEIADPPDKRLDRARLFHHDEIAESGLFADVETQHLTTVLHFDTPRYLTLLSTFSGHRTLPEEKRAPLHAALAALVDRYGGVVEHRITTALWLARKPGPATATATGRGAQRAGPRRRATADPATAAGRPRQPAPVRGGGVHAGAAHPTEADPGPDRRGPGGATGAASPPAGGA